MKKYILTKDFLEIPETYGLFQNLSGDANIEITNNTNEQGILLKPFQKLTINQQIYARKLGGGGTAQLMVLPFKNNSETVSADEVDSENYYSNESYVDENLNRPRRIKNQHNNFGYPYDWQHSREQPPPMPPPLPPQMFPPDNSAPAVVEHDNFYMLRIPKDSLNGQNKFLVQINDKKGD